MRKRIKREKQQKIKNKTTSEYARRKKELGRSAAYLLSDEGEEEEAGSGCPSRVVVWHAASRLRQTTHMAQLESVHRESTCLPVAVEAPSALPRVGVCSRVTSPRPRRHPHGPVDPINPIMPRPVRLGAELYADRETRQGKETRVEGHTHRRAWNDRTGTRPRARSPQLSQLSDCPGHVHARAVHYISLGLARILWARNLHTNNYI